MEDDQAARLNFRKIKIERLLRHEMNRNRVAAERVKNDNVVRVVRRGVHLQTRIAEHDVDRRFGTFVEIREVFRCARYCDDRGIDLVKRPMLIGASVSSRTADTESNDADVRCRSRLFDLRKDAAEWSVLMVVS